MVDWQAAAQPGRWQNGGWQVTFLEQNDHLASEASGNPQGVLYAKLSADNTPLSQFILKGYHYTLNVLETLEVQEWQQCGVIQLAIDDKTNQRYQALNSQHPDALLQYLNEQQLSAIAGLNINYPGLYFPQGGLGSSTRSLSGNGESSEYQGCHQHGHHST